MNEPENLLRVIFAEALEITDATQRSAFLDRACGSDTDLRRELEELIRAEADAGQFLPDQPAAATSRAAFRELVETADESGPIPTAPVTEKVGDRIGRYELLEKLGEGGCGVVYRAQQETPVRRQVALKVIKLGMDTRQVIARFEAERQALAMMDHPNIARVFDAGATDTGRPYFVMELVRGIKITDYCNQHQFRTRARIELFIQVCQAAQHAHQKGIIHRDLKPSNILVTVNDGVPVPKVIDFGIAKAIEGKLTDQTVFTAFEQFLGTPAYMSPEQAAMTTLDVDTRSDIYSLGVLLYELLTGTTPFDTKTLLALGVDELRRTIREWEPPKPSTRLTRERAATDTRRPTEGRKEEKEQGRSEAAFPKSALRIPHSEIDSDLDWIVMKCLEKDRARRYAAANELAADLKRHLNNEAVIARPPSRLYEFQKAVRRHKVSFAATAAVILVLVAGVIATTWQAIRARRAERERRAESYTSDMNLAKHAWDEGNLRGAQAFLRSHIPKRGAPDLRGFEWRYLRNLFRDESVKAIPITNDGVKILASSSAHSFVVVCCEKTIRLLDPTTGNEFERLWQSNRAATNVAYAIALASRATNLLATHWADGGVTLWDLGTQQRLLSFQAVFKNRAAVPEGDKFLALSPDGKLLAFGGPGTRSAELILWDISSTPQLAPRAVWTNEVTNGVISLAFTPDGQTLVTAESFRGSTLRTWDVRTGAEGKPFPKLSSGNIYALAVSPDGSLVAHAGLEARIHVLDFATRTLKCTFPGHSGEVHSLAFSADGRRLVSGGADGTVRVWDIPSQKPVGLWRDPQSFEVNSVVFTPDGSSIFSSNYDEIRTWSAGPHSPETVIETRQEWGQMAISLDGKWLVSSDSSSYSDGSAELPAARVWDIASRKPKFFLASKDRHPMAMAFSPPGNVFALGDGEKEGVIGLWNTANWDTASARVEPFRYLTNDFEAGSLCFSPDGKILAAAGLEFVSENPSGATNRLAFWEVGSWKKLNLLPGAGVGATERTAAASVDFSHNGRLVAIGYRDGWVRLWDFKQQRLLKEFQANENFGFAGAVVRFSMDDRWLVSILMGRNSLVLFDLTDLEHARPAPLSISDPAWIWSATFAPDNKSLVTADNDGQIKFWNLQTRRVALTLRHSEGPGGFLAFASDGHLLASKDGKGLVKLWTAPSLEEIDRWRKAK